MSGARPRSRMASAMAKAERRPRALSGRAWSGRAGSSQEDFACRNSRSWRMGPHPATPGPPCPEAIAAPPFHPPPGTPLSIPPDQPHLGATE